MAVGAESLPFGAHCRATILRDQQVGAPAAALGFPVESLFNAKDN